VIGKVIGWLVLFLVVCYLFGFSPAGIIGDIIHSASVMHQTAVTGTH
jgi:hypothetical protein